MKHVLLGLVSLLLSVLSGNVTAGCLTDTAQADFQAGIATNIDLATSPGNVLLSSAVATIDQQNTSASGGELFNNTQWVVQTFTAGATGALTRVDLNLFCNFCGGTPPPINVSIRATAGGLPTGNDLAIAPTNMDTSGAPKFYAANFSAPANVTAGTQYAIVIRASATFGSQLAFTVSATSPTQANDVYAGGLLGFSTNSGGAWSVQKFGTSTADGGFKTYVATGPAGHPAAGDLISSLKDSNPPAGTSSTWAGLTWTASLPTGTSVKFQAAGSGSTNGPFNFVGPDGTANTFFTASGASLAQFNGNRYLKYRAFLATTSSSVTPSVADATWCFASQAASADLSITNSDNVATAAPGGVVVYKIKASNLGSSAVSGANVSDTFTGLTCSWICSGTGGGTCDASGSGNINRSVNLPAGADVTFTATCSIPTASTGTLSNTATVATPAGTTDPNLGNNSATDVDTLALQADVVVTMTDGVDSAQMNDVIDYVINITNPNGPSNVSVNIADTLPAQLSGGSWTCVATSGATCAKAGGNTGTINSSAALPVGGKVTYTLGGLVSTDNASDQITNTVTASVVSGSDPDPGNNTVSDTDTVVVFISGFE